MNSTNKFSAFNQFIGKFWSLVVGKLTEQLLTKITQSTLYYIIDP